MSSVLPAGARAQPTRAWPRAAPMPAAVQLSLPGEARTSSPLTAGGASLLFPGLGQALLGQARWKAYAGMVVAGWLVELDQIRAGRAARAAYRDLAWMAARTMPGARTDGDWTYYQAIGAWSSSGAFDRDPARDGVQPETDLRTFNGNVWKKAHDIYVAFPRSHRQPVDSAGALVYYEMHAARPDFHWDWSGSEPDRTRYRRLFRESDDAFHAANLVLAAVLANHLFSAADAFVSASLGRPSPVRASVGSRSYPGGAVMEWRLGVRR